MPESWDSPFNILDVIGWNLAHLVKIHSIRNGISAKGQKTFTKFMNSYDEIPSYLFFALGNAIVLEVCKMTEKGGNKFNFATLFQKLKNYSHTKFDPKKICEAEKEYRQWMKVYYEDFKDARNNEMAHSPVPKTPPKKFGSQLHPQKVNAAVNKLRSIYDLLAEAGVCDSLKAQPINPKILDAFLGSLID